MYSAILKGKIEIESRFKKELPVWISFDKFADLWPVRILWGVLYILFYVSFATSWWMFLLLPIHFLIGPFHGAVINWFAHKIGYINFDLQNTSKNLMPLDLLMLGEGYHNNHHKYSGRANFAYKWFEFDPVYPIIKLFSLLRIIKLKELMHSESD